MIEIVPANDVRIIEDILLDAAQWLNSIGKPLWREEEVKWTHLSKTFSLSDFYIALYDRIPAACMAVIDHDPFLWPDVAKGQSLFVHKLAVKRFAAGKGLSGAMLNYAKALCRNKKISMLRLDCHSLMPKLRAVYERNGFTCVAEKFMFEKYHIAFYECRV